MKKFNRSVEHVVCVKVGDKYNADYVNRLESMVRRHTTRPVRVLCLTDDPKDVHCETADIGTTLPGWWAKLVLFGEHSALPDHFVYLDLDTVILRNIDFLFNYIGSFCLLRDFWSPVYNSSVMAIEKNVNRHVLHGLPMNYQAKYHGDQDWITHAIPSADLWDIQAPGRIGSYKAHCLAESGPGSYAIVCFHGDPKPHTFSEGWVYENWR